MALGLVTQPERLGGAASGGGGLPDDAVQFLGYDPAGGDERREWRVKNLNDFLSVAGGLTPVLATFEFAFDTPGLQGGLLAFTLPVGSYLPTNLASTLMITESWDGTTPQINLAPDQAGAASGLVAPSVYTPTQDTDHGNGTFTSPNPNAVFGLSSAYVTPSALEWWVGADDGFGGPIGATQGAARLVLVYYPVF